LPSNKLSEYYEVHEEEGKDQPYQPKGSRNIVIYKNFLDAKDSKME